MKEGIHIADKEETKKRKNSLIVIMLCLIMVIAGTIAGIFLAPLFHKDNNYDKNAVDIVQQSDDSQIQEFADNIAIPCWDSLTIKANEYKQSVNFYNPAANKGINFKLALSLDDGTKLYQSDLIPCGKAIYNITMDSTLEPGTYNAILDYECFTTDGRQLNGSSMSFILKMEE